MIYLFVYLDIQRHPHLHDSGFSVEVKDDRAKNTIARRWIRIRKDVIDKGYSTAGAAAAHDGAAHSHSLCKEVKDLTGILK